MASNHLPFSSFWTVAAPAVLALVVLSNLVQCSGFLQQPTPTVIPGQLGSTRVAQDGAEMVYVPAGDFLMGSGASDPQAAEDEKPQHTVYLDPFWIDKFEVTNALYRHCVDAGKCGRPGDLTSYTRTSYFDNPQFANYPANYISWQDARAYCIWAGKHLPTEAQWEKAARGTDGRIYPWGNTWDPTKLNSKDKGPGDTTAVGSYPAGASPYGGMDLAGNAWEWVADWYGADYYANSPRNNPSGPSGGESRVLRGGSWDSSEVLVRAASRSNDYAPGHTLNDFGFRCAQ